MHAHMHTHGGDTTDPPRSPATPPGMPSHLRGSATLTAIHTDVPQGVPSVPRPGAWSLTSGLMSPTALTCLLLPFSFRASWGALDLLAARETPGIG